MDPFRRGVPLAPISSARDRVSLSPGAILTPETSSEASSNRSKAIFSTLEGC